MIVKPVEQTPPSTLYYTYLAKEAGIPYVVLNDVTSFGKTIIASICSDMDVYMVILLDLQRLVVLRWKQQQKVT